MLILKSALVKSLPLRGTHRLADDVASVGEHRQQQPGCNVAAINVHLGNSSGAGVQGRACKTGAASSSGRLAGVTGASQDRSGIEIRGDVAFVAVKTLTLALSAMGAYPDPRWKMRRRQPHLRECACGRLRPVGVRLKILGANSEPVYRGVPSAGGFRILGQPLFATTRRVNRVAAPKC